MEKVGSLFVVVVRWRWWCSEGYSKLHLFIEYHPLACSRVHCSPTASFMLLRLLFRAWSTKRLLPRDIWGSLCRRNELTVQTSVGNEQDTLAGRDPVDVLTLCCAEVDTF